MTVSISGTNGVTFPDSSLQAAAASPYVLKNRIINGAMVVDQRNAGASVTPTASSYTLDRWRATLSVASKFSVQQSSTAPTGFNNSLLVTSLSSYSVLAGDFFNIQQRIEGFNVADLGWGTADAKTVTLSFWVKSSLTGTFGGALQNSAGNRCYPFTYSISSANTWEQKSITIAGDTTGTWLTTNGIGIIISIGLGVGSTYSGTAGAWAGTTYNSATGSTSVVGTNGATFYITGVQLELGSTATPFERRLYNQELSNCQRYYYKLQSNSADSFFGSAFNVSTTLAIGITFFPVTLRTAPSALEQSGTAGDYRVRAAAGNTNCSAVPTWDGSSVNNGTTIFTVASGLTSGQGVALRAVNSSAYLAWSAEL